MSDSTVLTSGTQSPDAALPTEIPRASRRQRVLVTAVAVALTLVFCWGVILSGNLRGRGAVDDLQYHWLTIQQFAQQLPTPDISDYRSATTPGYHLVLAPLVAAGMDHTGVQLVASVWTLGLIGVMAWVVSGRYGLGAIPLVLPMIASMYVIYQGIWLLPDNMGWLMVLLILLLQFRCRPGAWLWVVSGLLLVLLVWVRQIHIWVAAIVWLGAWLGSEEETPTVREFFGSFTQRAGRTALSIASTVPAFAMIAWFALLWGGLVPPLFQRQHQGLNLATPGFILAQMSILSLFFAPVLLPAFRRLWKRHRGWVIMGLAIGLILGIAPDSVPTRESGRYSGWWHLIGMFPDLNGKSVMYIPLSVAGGLATVIWLSLLSRRDAWMWAGVLLAFVTAQCTNQAAWQRYQEPMLLIMVLLILTRASISSRQAFNAKVGAGVLAGVLLAININSMINAQPVTPVEDLDSLSVSP